MNDLEINLPCVTFFMASKEKGFWDSCITLDPDRVTTSLNRELVIKSIPEKLALIHSEVSEALEDYRAGLIYDDPNATNENGKPVGFASELADIVIRVMDLAGAMNINLTHEIVRKMEYNKTRSYKHGKRC